MYPTLSHLIYDLFGILYVSLIQTFGLGRDGIFIVSWTLTLELKEKVGIIKPTEKFELIGVKLSFRFIFLLITGSFLVDLKLVEAYLNYSDLVINPQALFCQQEDI